MGGDAMAPSANASPGASPAAATAGDRDAGPAQRVTKRGCGAARRLRRDDTAVAGPVDRQRRQRRRLVDVVRRLPTGPGTAGVEEGLVAEDAAGHVAEAAGVQLHREPAQVAGGERRVAVALEDQVAVPDAVDQLAVAEHGRLDPVGRPERDQGGVADGELLVRGRRECQRPAPLEQALAGTQVDGDRGGQAGSRCGQRALEPRGELPRDRCEREAGRRPRGACGPGGRRTAGGRQVGECGSAERDSREEQHAVHRAILRRPPAAVNRPRSTGKWAGRPM